MVRILYIIGGLVCGGMETSVVNYYHHIDRLQIQFDFLFATEKQHENGKCHYIENCDIIYRIEGGKVIRER